MHNSMKLLLAAACLLPTACNPSGPAPANESNSEQPANTTGTIDSGGLAEANAAAVPGGADAAIPCPFAGTRDWKAWVDAMPGPGKVRTLYVTGEVNVGPDGYAGKLTAGKLDKSLPPIQHVELNLVEQPGAKKGWQDTPSFSIKPALTYKAVVIDCHGTEVGRVEPVPITQ